jgi:hypothetical protein
MSNDNNKPYFKLLVALLIVLGATLPFHYVPASMKVFPKDNLTFSYTIITQEDVDNLLKRYNDCETILQQQSIRTEPLFRKLSDQGLIWDEKKNDDND